MGIYSLPAAGHINDFFYETNEIMTKINDQILHSSDIDENDKKAILAVLRSARIELQSYRNYESRHCMERLNKMLVSILEEIEEQGFTKPLIIKTLNALHKIASGAFEKG